LINKEREYGRNARKRFHTRKRNMVSPVYPIRKTDNPTLNEEDKIRIF
jgi:hypothetical protein